MDLFRQEEQFFINQTLEEEKPQIQLKEDSGISDNFIIILLNDIDDLGNFRIIN